MCKGRWLPKGQTEGLSLPQSPAACQLPAGNPRRGSDSPPDCHSLPRRRFAYPLHKGAFAGDHRSPAHGSPVGFAASQGSPCQGSWIFLCDKQRKRLRGSEFRKFFSPSVFCFAKSTSCCGDAKKSSGLRFSSIFSTAATRSARFICHWQRSHRSPSSEGGFGCGDGLGEGGSFGGGAGFGFCGRSMNAPTDSYETFSGDIVASPCTTPPSRIENS